MLLISISYIRKEREQRYLRLSYFEIINQSLCASDLLEFLTRLGGVLFLNSEEDSESNNDNSDDGNENPYPGDWLGLFWLGGWGRFSWLFSWLFGWGGGSFSEKESIGGEFISSGIVIGVSVVVFLNLLVDFLDGLMELFLGLGDGLLDFSLDLLFVLLELLGSLLSLNLNLLDNLLSLSLNLLNLLLSLSLALFNRVVKFLFELLDVGFRDVVLVEELLDLVSDGFTVDISLSAPFLLWGGGFLGKCKSDKRNNKCKEKLHSLVNDIVINSY